MRTDYFRNARLSARRFLRCGSRFWFRQRSLLIITLLSLAVAHGQEDFTIAVLPDTQNYAASLHGGTPEIFKAQTQWIADNRDNLNIVYVPHLGDCVNYADREEEWKHADAAFRILEGPRPIPYGIAVGNHDKYIYRPLPVFIDGVRIETTQLYNRYFGTARFKERPWYGENYGVDNDNFYHLFSAGGLDFIAVFFEYAAGSDALGWADELLEKHRDRRAIIVSHSLLELDKTFGYQGQATYDVLKDNPNFFMMLCGHVLGEAQREDTYNGSTVYSLLSDYQGREKGGDGWLRIMRFSPAQNRIHVSTYSPTLKKHERDADSQFTLEYQMSSGARLR